MIRINTDTNGQLQELLRAMRAVRNGDLTIRLDKKKADIFGEMADVYKDMVDTLNLFAGEVAREIGTDGKLGGQAKVPGAAGTWWITLIPWPAT